MFASCKIVRMQVPFTPQQIIDAIVELVGRNKLKSCYIRPLVYRGYDNVGLDPRSCPVDVAIMAFEWGRYLGAESIEKGVDVGISSWRRMAPDTFPALGKIGGQYVNSQFIAMEAVDHGYQEGVALDVFGHVSEGSGDNIFVVSAGVIYTPPIAASILRGVTRYATMALARDLGLTVVEQNIPREMLYIADEVFITGTAAEIVPIRSVDHIKVGAGERGPITRQLQNEFYAIVEGRSEDKYHWLTFVK
jgi:branched-chain amino acid aminotransferase